MAAMKQVFDSLTGGAYTPADQPKCPNHTQALKGYECGRRAQTPG
jgi:hypothetical protein